MNTYNKKIFEEGTGAYNEIKQIYQCANELDTFTSLHTDNCICLLDYISRLQDRIDELEMLHVKQ